MTGTDAPQGASAAEAVHRSLREGILEGRFASGEVLEQHRIGRLLGVSATPVREALRMLHEEGLVIAAPQQRARVVGFDPDQVEALYAERIAVEAVGASLTAVSIGAEGLAGLNDALERMSASRADNRGPDADWHQAHRDFHLIASSALGRIVQARIAANFDRSRHYVQMHRPETTDGWLAPDRWHRATLAAIEYHDPRASAVAMAQDLGNAATALIRFMSPEHEPQLIPRIVASFSTLTV